MSRYVNYGECEHMEILVYTTLKGDTNLQANDNILLPIRAHQIVQESGLYNFKNKINIG